MLLRYTKVCASFVSLGLVLGECSRSAIKSETLYVRPIIGMESSAGKKALSSKFVVSQEGKKKRERKPPKKVYFHIPPASATLAKFLYSFSCISSLVSDNNIKCSPRIRTQNGRFRNVVLLVGSVLNNLLIICNTYFSTHNFRIF